MHHERSYKSPTVKIVALIDKRLLCTSPSEGGTENIAKGNVYTNDDF